MKKYQIIIECDDEIVEFEFHDSKKKRAKVLSVIDITSIYNNDMTDYMSSVTISDEVGEA